MRSFDEDACPLIFLVLINMAEECGVFESVKRLYLWADGC